MVDRFDGHSREHTTPGEIPDPEVKPRICGPLIMVRPLEPAKTLNHGSLKLHLPDQYVDDAKFLTNVGRVYVVGNLAYEEARKDENRFGRQQWCKEGDYVVWRKHGGHKIVYKGVIFTILNDDEVLMTIEDPTDIDVNKNMIKI